jgi:hypothetical protein
MDTNKIFSRSLVLQVLLSITAILLFSVWVEYDAPLLHTWVVEDGPVETLSAIFFGISSLGFLVVAARSNFLSSKTYGLRYPMVLAWALLMFVFMGEEISWGQRIFGFGTPEALLEINHQHEFNIHNIEFVDSFMGGKYRYLSIMMLTTGLVLPLFALSGFGRRVIQWWGFPVAPIGYSLAFVGAYAYGKYFHGITIHSNDSTEMREFLMSVAMLLFSLHGAIRPCDLFRACNPLTSRR